MSLCDICPRPGHCCTGLSLGGGDFGRFKNGLEVLVEIAGYIRWGEDTNTVDLLPFMPLRRNEFGMWNFWCPNLTREGRCGDYENRPFACRHYQPLDDGLCAQHKNLITRNAFKHLRLESQNVAHESQ